MTYERRQGNTFAMIALVITLLTNIIGLTWGASKVSSAIDALNKATTDLGVTVKELQTFNTKIDIRTSVLEAKSK